MATVQVPTPPLAAAPAPGAARRPRRRRIERLARQPTLLLGVLLVAAVVVIAASAPLLAPYDPTAQVGKQLLLPGQGYLLGTDELGRDELSRLLHGARIALYVGVFSVAIATALGASSGIVSGFYGGWVDSVLMRIMDVLFSLPAVVLAIAITSVLGPSLTNAMIAVGIVYAPTFARIARGPTLMVVQLPYIEAARAIGLPGWRIMVRHVLPNISAPLLVHATVALSTAILTEAALSFLGVGTQPPAPSWGLMLNASRQFMLIDPWIAVLPGVAIALTVLGFNLLGDGLRDLLDPRLRL